MEQVQVRDRHQAESLKLFELRPGDLVVTDAGYQVGSSVEMTQQALADRVGVTRQTIIALEAGKYTPSLILAFRLARTFGVAIEGVFQYDGVQQEEGTAQS